MSPWRRAGGPDNLPAATARRRNERYLLSTRLTACIHAAQSETKIQTLALDISESGIGAISTEDWIVGSHAHLEVLLPLGSGPLEIHAVVRHRTGLRCGLEFVEVSPEQQRALQDACRLLAVPPARPRTQA